MSASGYTKHGEAYIFGMEGWAVDSIKSQCGLVPTKLDFNHTPEFTAEGYDTNGKTVSFVTGDDFIEGTLEGFLEDYAVFTAATEFNIGDKYFMIMGRGEPREIRQMAKVTMTVRHYQGITGPAT